MQYTLTHETPDDAQDIEALLDLAFGPGRQSRTVFRFRDGRAPLGDFGFTARMDGKMVASIRFWPVTLPSGQIVPMLGPLAVQPNLRGEGLGRALVRKGRDAVHESGAPAVLIVGDPGYYAPFGFSVDPVQGLDLGGPLAPLTLMGIEFRPSALTEESGRVEPVARDL